METQVVISYIVIALMVVMVVVVVIVIAVIVIIILLICSCLKKLGMCMLYLQLHVCLYHAF